MLKQEKKAQYYRNYLINDTTKYYILTVLKIRLNWESLLPNRGTRSDHLLGYVNLLNIIIRASSPVAVVPCLHVYLFGKRNDVDRRSMSFFSNLLVKTIKDTMYKFL